MTATRRARVLGVAVIAASALLLLMASAQAADGAGQFHRGIGISHAMAWARVEPGPARVFAFPPFSDPDNALTAAALQTLHRSGFDFIRFAVDPGPFLQYKGDRRAALDRMLLNRVHLILTAGLSVIVDFHPSDIHPDYTAGALTAGLDTPLFRAYLGLLERTAVLLDGLHTPNVALELMNEPPSPPAQWQPMLEAAYAAARGRAAGLVLVLEGGSEASMPALMAMQTMQFAADPAALLSFHYYEPYQFTHQGAPWNPARYLADVPYPAHARPLDDSLAATAAAIAESGLGEQPKSEAYLDAKQRLESYWTSNFNADSIAKNFAQIAAWARSQGIPADRILLGEFGARKTVLQFGDPGAAERRQWFHDVSHAAEREGFGWAVWAYRGGGGFALARNDTADDVDPDIVAALGLSADAAAPALRHARFGDPR
jgi:hypothetical protein